MPPTTDVNWIKAAALALDDRIITLTGEYTIDDTGKQYENEFAIMPAGPEADFPAAVTTAKGVSCAPAFSEG